MWEQSKSIDSHILSVRKINISSNELSIECWWTRVYLEISILDWWTARVWCLFTDYESGWVGTALRSTGSWHFLNRDTYAYNLINLTTYLLPSFCTTNARC